MLENECLTAMVLSGASPLYAKKIAGALATLDADQRELAVAFLAWTLGHGPCPYLLRPDVPVERSAHEPPE